LVCLLVAAKFYGENPPNRPWQRVLEQAVHEDLGVHSPSSTVAEFSQPWWEYLHHRNWHMPQTSFFSPRKSVIKHYPDTTSSGGMKNPAMALLPPP